MSCPHDNSTDENPELDERRTREREDVYSIDPYMLALLITVLLTRMNYDYKLLLALWVLIDIDTICSCMRRLLGRCTGSILFESVDPAFVVNPNSETMGWFNDCVDVLWSKCIRGVVRYDLPGFANDFLRNLCLPISIFCPRILTLDLGPNPLYVTAVKTHRPTQIVDDPLQEKLHIDVGIILEASPNVEFTLGYLVSLGLKKLSFSAPCRLSLLPITSDSKLLGDIFVSFLHEPRFDFELDGALNPLNFACIKLPLHFIISWIFSFAKYPNQYCIPVESTRTGMKALLPTVPRGLLRIKILRGENIMPKKTPFVSIWLSKCRPYSLMSLAEGEKLKDKKSITTYNNFVVEFPLADEDVANRSVTVEILDKSFNPCTDASGLPINPVKFPIEQFIEQRKRKLAISLTRGEIPDKLVLFFQFFDKHMGTQSKARLRISQNPLHSHAVLSLVVHQVKTKESLQHPLVSVVVAGSAASITTSTNAPSSKFLEFCEHFMFPVHDVKTDKVTFSLMDKFETEDTEEKPHKETYLKEVKAENLELRGLPWSNDSDSRGPFYLFGSVSKNVEEFTGQLQTFQFQSHPSEYFQISVIAQLYFLS